MLVLAVMVQISYAQRGGGAKGKKNPPIAESEVPAAVTTTFKSKFADANDVKWRLTKKGNYKASFKNATGKVSSVFATLGKEVKPN